MHSVLRIEKKFLAGALSRGLPAYDEKMKLKKVRRNGRIDNEVRGNANTF